MFSRKPNKEQFLTMSPNHSPGTGSCFKAFILLFFALTQKYSKPTGYTLKKNHKIDDKKRFLARLFVNMVGGVSRLPYMIMARVGLLNRANFMVLFYTRLNPDHRGREGQKL